MTPRETRALGAEGGGVTSETDVCLPCLRLFVYLSSLLLSDAVILCSYSL